MNYQIILIDDDCLTNFIHRKILSRHLPGVDIHEYSDPAKALSYLGLNASRVDVEFLILLDINMPALCGWDVLETIELSIPELNATVALLTSSIDKADRTKAFTYDRVFSFVSKPLDRDKIKGILDSMATFKTRKRFEA